MLAGIVGDTLAGSGNVIINKDYANKYDVKIYIQGTNEVTTIMPNIYNSSALYEGNISFYGEDDGKLYLGAFLGNEEVNFYGLKLEEITDFTSEYIIYIASDNESHGNIKFNYCNVSAPNKRVYSKRGNIYYYSYSTLTIAEIGSSCHYGLTGLNGKCYLHVLNDLMGAYGSVNIVGDSSLVVEGNILTTYSHWSVQPFVNTTGYVIVKGNRFDAENIKFSAGTIVTNLLEVGRFCNLNGGTLITNLISNPVCKYPRSRDSDGNYLFVYDGNTSDANFNDDNYPFLTRVQNNSTAGIYSFNGTNVYILGNYNILDSGTYRYDTSKKTTDYSELNNVIEQLVTNGKITKYPEIVEKTNETIIIGSSEDNSTYNVRTVKISNGNIYASGNITFFNDVIVTGGNINCTGIFSSKRNLEITGGTINAKEIGNSYNLTTSNNGLKNWKTTTITGGTLTAQRIGATSNNINGIESRGTLIINGESRIINSSNFVTDTYINYIYDSNVFKNSNTINSIRFSANKDIGIINNIGDLTIIEPALENDKYYFAKPTINNIEQKWKFQNLNGIDVEYIDNNGYINGEKNQNAVYYSTQLNLYSAKEKYNLTVHGKNHSAMSNEETINFTNNIAEIKSGNTVKLTVDESVIDKTVVWYKDSAGLVYNAIDNENDIDKENNIITFKMPNADTEIWIIDGQEIESLNLDLYSYNISILSDGFATEINDNRRSDSIFKYNGDITISQSNIAGTTYTDVTDTPIRPTTGNYNNKLTCNKIYTEGTNPNSIFLTRIIQDSVDSTDDAFVIEENVEAKFIVDGPTQIKTIKLPETSTLDMTGKNIHDVLYIKNASSSQCYKISNGNDKTGSATFNNLLIQAYRHDILLYNKNSYTEYLNMNDCIYNNQYVDTMCHIAIRVKNVNITNSEINLIGATGYGGVVFENVKNVKLTGGVVTNVSGGSTYGRTFLSGVENIELNDAILTENLRNSISGGTYYENLDITVSPKTVTLNGNSQFNSNYRYMFRDKLILNDTSSINIGDDNNPGYLFAPNIEVNDQAKINSANVIIAGYYNFTTEVTTKNELLNKLSQNISIKDGKDETGLKINGGTVNAKEFIGGDVNATIEINGGIINSNKIGTAGKLFGFAKYIPKVGEEYVYTYAKIPSKGTKVIINSGIVNISKNGYLGGMNGQVYINGGKINLESNSYIGINETDTTKLVNSITSQGNTPNELVNINVTGGTVEGENAFINAPYSTIEINATTNNPAIQTKEVIADNGTVNIRGSKNHYDNPLGEGERVGIIVNQDLIAQNISISEGASVYAKNALSKTNTVTAKGIFKISANSYLYTVRYGSEGSGTSTVVNEGTIIGNRQYAILYNMNDTYTDRAQNSNQVTYMYGEKVILKKPTRCGYNFEGWYDSDNNEVTEISNTDKGDKILNAKWTEKTVDFIIKIKASDVGISKEEFASQVDNNLGKLNDTGDVFTYTKKLSIKYHALLNTELLLSNYNLSTYFASAAKIDNITLNPEDDILNLTSTGMTVTKEIMEYYLNNNKPIEVSICEFIFSEVSSVIEE